MKVGLETILDNGHLENVTVGPATQQIYRATQPDSQAHGTRQDVTPPVTLPDAGSLWRAVAARSPNAAVNASAAVPNVTVSTTQNHGMRRSL